MHYVYYKTCFSVCKYPVGICVPVCMCVHSMLGLLPVRAGYGIFSENRIIIVSGCVGLNQTVHVSRRELSQVTY